MAQQQEPRDERLTTGPGIEWLPWGPEAFERAEREQKPVLLDIYGVWCHWCHVMDEGTYEHPEVVRLVRERFVPVRVDTDKRPDVNERYNQGGWPTTAFLDPTGHVLFGATYLPPEQMVLLLRNVSDAYQRQRDNIAERVRQLEESKATARSSAGEPDAKAIEGVLRSLRRNYDPEFGGFGTQPKFPQPAALEFALAQQAVTGDAQLREIAQHSLRGMARLLDPVDGGFFRYSTNRDWSIPHYEKMLEGNACLLAAYAEGYRALRDETFLPVITSVANYLTSTLYDPERHAFKGSQDADVFSHDPQRQTIDGEVYFALPAQERRRIGEPYVDPTLYTNFNAMAVRGFVKAYLATNDPSYLEIAQDTAHFLLTTVTAGDGSYHHYLDPHQGPSPQVGLLADQVWVARALLDLYEATGDDNYLGGARDAMEFARIHLAAPGGGFYDILAAEDAVGLLRTRDVPLISNALAAEVLLRLAVHDQAPADRDAAQMALGAVSDLWERYGFLAAEYAHAVWWATTQLPTLTVWAARPQERKAFAKAAFEAYVPGLTVSFRTPAAADDVRAVVCAGTVCQTVPSPDDLPQVLWALREHGQ